MSFKFPVYRYALFFKGPEEMLMIDEEHADRTEVSRSWQECARVYPRSACDPDVETDGSRAKMVQLRGRSNA